MGCELQELSPLARAAQGGAPHRAQDERTSRDSEAAGPIDAAVFHADASRGVVLRLGSVATLCARCALVPDELFVKSSRILISANPNRPRPKQRVNAWLRD